MFGPVLVLGDGALRLPEPLRQQRLVNHFISSSLAPPTPRGAAMQKHTAQSVRKRRQRRKNKEPRLLEQPAATPHPLPVSSDWPRKWGKGRGGSELRL